MSAALRVLIVGGYGNFGLRLATLLAPDPRLALVIAGRSRDKAAAACAGLPQGAAREAAAFDRDGDVAAALRAIAPDLVVDASGPFQEYGAAPYRVVEACLALGIDYVDLADGADFVTGIARFDAPARAGGVFVLSGASTCPALTVAAVRALAADLAAVDSIAGGIAPSPFAGIGGNVLRAIAGYAGRAVTVVRDGGPATATALLSARSFTVAPPGALPLRRRRFSLIEVPELRVLPALWPAVRDVWFGAGTVPAGLHRGLNLAAWLVRLRLLPSLRPFAGAMIAAMRRLRWGEHRGGMFVAVTGRDAAGAPRTRSWHMVAEGDDGPFIPAMAAAAIVARVAEGRRPAAGARPLTELAMDDFAPLFARRAIRSGVRETPPDGAAPLYRRVLGTAWESLPAPIRALHDVTAARTWSGRATVERGGGLAARLVAAAVGLPRAGADVPVTVTLAPRGAGEEWRRDFAGRRFASTQSAGRGRFAHLVCERFGPVTVALAPVVDGGRLRIVVRGWRAFGLPLPASWAPGGDTWESADGGRFNFHVEMTHPWLGPIVRYRGWLALQAHGEPDAVAQRRDRADPGAPQPDEPQQAAPPHQ